MSTGYLYCMYSPSIRYHKIGMTTRSVEERLREANSSTWSIPDFEIKLFKKVRDVESRELTLHKIFDAFRVHSKREFFDVPLEMIQLHFDLMDEIEDETKQQDIYNKFLDEVVYPLDDDELCTVPWTKIEDHFQQWKKSNDIIRGNTKELRKLIEDTYGKPNRGVWESCFKIVI